jgi:hypothetical protein
VIPERDDGPADNHRSPRLYLERRWSGSDDAARARVVPIDAGSGTDRAAETDGASNGKSSESQDLPPDPPVASLAPDGRGHEPESRAVEREARSFASQLSEARSASSMASRAVERETVVQSAVVHSASQPVATEAAPDAEGRLRVEWCAIVFAATQRRGEFQAVVLDDGGQRRVIARSPSFRSLRSGRIRQTGNAKKAHHLLVRRMLALGWRTVSSRGRWHDTAFTRTPPGHDSSIDRLLILCQRGGMMARFQAARLDELGDTTIIAQSSAFGAIQIGGTMRLAWRARKAHETLLDQLQSDGWQATGASGLDWYAQVLEKPVRPQPIALTERESAASRA